MALIQVLSLTVKRGTIFFVQWVKGEGNTRILLGSKRGDDLFFKFSCSFGTISERQKSIKKWWKTGEGGKICGKLETARRGLPNTPLLDITHR